MPKSHSGRSGSTRGRGTAGMSRLSPRGAVRTSRAVRAAGPVSASSSSSASCTPEVVWPARDAFGVKGGSLLVQTDLEAWWYGQMVRPPKLGLPDLDGLSDLTRPKKGRHEQGQRDED